MRGNPIKEWIIFSALWLLLLIPVIKLTGERKLRDPSEINPAAGESAKIRSATALFRYTGKPLFIEVIQDGKSLCKINTPPEGECETGIDLSIDGRGAELHLRAEWPDTARHALELELLPDGEPERKIHCWAKRDLDEILSFEW